MGICTLKEQTGLIQKQRKNLSQEPSVTDLEIETQKPNTNAFKNLIQRNWEEWQVNEYDSTISLETGGNLGSLGITSLTLSSSPQNQYKSLRTILSNCPNLKKLSLKESPYPDMISQTIALLSKYKNLQQISLHSFEKQFQLQLMSLPHIKVVQIRSSIESNESFFDFSEKIPIELKINRWKIKSAQEMEQLTETLKDVPQLVSLQLKLSFAKNIPNALFPYFLKLPKSIRQLTLANSPHASLQDPSSFILTLNQLTQLECLKLYFISFISSNFNAETLTLLQTTAREIHICCKSFTSDNFSKFCANNKRVQILVFKDCFFKGEIPTGIEFLCLQSLELSGDEIKEQGFKIIVESQPQLRSLSLNNCWNIENKCLQEISKLSQLEQLRLSTKWIIREKWVFLHQGFTYLRRLRKLNVFEMDCFRGRIDSTEFLKLMLNWKSMAYFESTNLDEVIQDTWNRRKMLQSFNRGTRVWIREKDRQSEA